MSFSMNDNAISLEAYRQCPEFLRKRVKLSAFTEAEYHRRLEEAQRKRGEVIKRGIQKAITEGYARWMLLDD